MSKTKVLSLVLAGAMLLSISGASVAGGVAEVRETGKTKENMLAEISATVRDRTQERAIRMSSLVKAAVQIARTEEEAQKAAEEAAKEAKAKQEAEEKERKEKAEAEERAKKEVEEARKKAAGEDAATEASAADVVDSDYVAGPVYETQNAVYYEVPFDDTLYAESVSYDGDSYTVDAYAYTEPQYVYDTPDTGTYDVEPEGTSNAMEPVYEADAIGEPLTTGYDETVYDEEPIYSEELSYADEGYADVYDDSGVRATATDSDLDLLASIIYCEAGGESYEGQVAVGAVVLNRMESSLYPDDMSDVIYQSGQFTPAMTGWLDQVRSSGVPEYCYDAAQAALNGENPVGDCLYFHAGGGDGLTIGNQTFY